MGASRSKKSLSSRARGTRQKALRERHAVMEAAVNEVASNTLSIRAAARKYSVNYRTLAHQTKKAAVNVNPGPITKSLTQHDEDELAAWCLQRSQVGLPVTRSEVCETARRILSTYPSTASNTKCNAGATWWSGFLARHANLAIRTSQHVDEGRAQMVNHAAISKQFDLLTHLHIEHEYEPSQIWNIDEKGIILEGKQQPVIAETGARHVPARRGGNRQHLTIVPTVSAAGTTGPSMIIYPRKLHDDRMFHAKDTVLNIAVGCNESGYMTSDLFVEFLKHFVASIGPQRPQLLILDGHVSHVSYEAAKYARDAKIDLFALVPHTTHVTQPLDVGLFHPFQSHYDTAVVQWNSARSSLAEHLSIYSAGAIVRDIWLKVFTQSSIQAAFRRTGLWPLDKTAIPSTSYSLATLTERSPGNQGGTKEPQPLRSGALEESPPSTTAPAPRIRRHLSEIAQLEQAVATLQAQLAAYQAPGSTPLSQVLQYTLSSQTKTVDGGARSRKTNSARVLTSDAHFVLLEEHDRAKAASLQAKQERATARAVKAAAQQQQQVLIAAAKVISHPGQQAKRTTRKPKQATQSAIQSDQSDAQTDAAGSGRVLTVQMPGAASPPVDREAMFTPQKNHQHTKQDIPFPDVNSLGSKPAQPCVDERPKRTIKRKKWDL